MAIDGSTSSNEGATTKGGVLTYSFIMNGDDIREGKEPRLSGHNCPRAIKEKGEQKVVNVLQSSYLSRMGLLCPIS